MGGVTKHIFNADIKDIVAMWDDEIKSIQPLLPREYTEKDIISQLKKYYPYEWKSVEYKYSYYQSKDKFLQRRLGKCRYCMPNPETLIKSVKSYIKLLSRNIRQQHRQTYSDRNCQTSSEELWNRRKSHIERIDKKIELALSKTQRMEPEFIDQLMGLYKRKNTTMKDRAYILLELQKYYNPKIIRFFFKLNDTEINLQLRNEAFCHLQGFNFHPRLRKQQFMQVHTKNRKRKQYLKKEYAYEKYEIPKCPDELEYRINNSQEQKLKTYDYFISHSSIDSKAVQKLIFEENDQGKNVFCDWINDVDYLKRHLLCEATLNVLKKRMEQSKALIFVKSENSLISDWCSYELNYFHQFNRPMFFITKEDIINKNFELQTLDSKEFLDKDYEKKVLIAGSNIHI